MSAFDELTSRISRPDGARRLGQALWMLVGERIESPASLLWAKALAGADGDEVLWRALCDRGYLDQYGALLPRPLAEFLCSIWSAPEHGEPTLLWTLPDGLVVSGIDPMGYVSGVIALVRSARERLLLVAPFLEAKGVGKLQEEVLAALARGVAVTFVTQDAAFGSWASDSLESVRREARGLVGDLCVYTASATLDVLLHSKLAVADGIVASVGSANLTGKALTKNLETGVVVGAAMAQEIERVLRRLIEFGYVTLAFDTKCG